MKTQSILIIALVLALTAAGYVVGYHNGGRREKERREAKGRLSVNLRLYEAAQRGDLPGLQRDLEMVILGQTRTFEEQHGAPRAGEPFADRFAFAQTIASQVESRLVRFDSARDITNTLGRVMAPSK